MRILTLLCAIFLVLFSCQDANVGIELPVNIVEEIDSILIWKTPKNSDTINSTSAETIFYNDKVVFSNYIFGKNVDEEVVAVDVEGNELWRWSAFIDENKIQKITPDWRTLNNKLVFSSWKDNYCLDMNSGQELWRFIYPYGDPRISVGLESLVMKPIWFSQSSPRSDSTSIMIADVNEGEFREVFKIRKQESIKLAFQTLSHILI